MKVKLQRLVFVLKGTEYHMTGDKGEVKIHQPYPSINTFEEKKKCMEYMKQFQHLLVEEDI